MQYKILHLITGFVFLSLFSSFKPVAEDGIKINVTNLRSNNGNVLVSLFKDGVGYPDDATKAFRKTKLSITDKKASILFSNLPSGVYTVSILHDENDDQKMNKNGLGIPKEGFGFSNNVMGAFGPPSLSKSSFKHTATSLTQKDIRIRY